MVDDDSPREEVRPRDEPNDGPRREGAARPLPVAATRKAARLVHEEPAREGMRERARVYVCVRARARV